MKIKQLLAHLGPFEAYSDFDDFQVQGISCNSKHIGNSDVFVAIKGVQEDGNKFIDQAILKGAKLVIVEQFPRGVRNAAVPFVKVKDTRRALAELAAHFYGRPSSKLKVIGITGTNGKTSITYLIEAILKMHRVHPAVIGTINYRFKERVISSKNTTPGPLELERMLADMLKEGVDYCIMEVSSHALDQDRTAGINFHSAIFTNFTQDHLDYHKNLRNYFASKAKLFRNLNPGSFAVINHDNEFGRKLKRLTRAKIITYGLNKGAQVTAKDIKFDSHHTEFRLISPQGEMNYQVRLIGRHNIYNILASIAWAQEEGIGLAVIEKALKGFRRVPGRLERIEADTDFSVFVDYAHTEDALKNVLDTLRQVCARKIIVVFGCGGDRDKTKRPKMGRVATQGADYAVITSDNPRSENPLAIIKNIQRGIRKKNFCVVPKRAEAIKKALRLAGKGDIVLIAGKGHENYQIIKDKIMHFDDREAVRECLKSMRS